MGPQRHPPHGREPWRVAVKRIFLDLETLPDGEPDLFGLVDPASIVVMHNDDRIRPD